MQKLNKFSKSFLKSMLRELRIVKANHYGGVGFWAGYWLKDVESEIAKGYEKHGLNSKMLDRLYGVTKSLYRRIGLPRKRLPQ